MVVARALMAGLLLCLILFKTSCVVRFRILSLAFTFKITEEAFSMLNQVSIDTQSAFHLTKNFGTFEAGTNGTEIPLESFRKVKKKFNFRIANHSTENFKKKKQ